MAVSFVVTESMPVISGRGRAGKAPNPDTVAAFGLLKDGKPIKATFNIKKDAYATATAIRNYALKMTGFAIESRIVENIDLKKKEMTYDLFLRLTDKAPAKRAPRKAK